MKQTNMFFACKNRSRSEIIGGQPELSPGGGGVVTDLIDIGKGVGHEQVAGRGTSSD